MLYIIYIYILKITGFSGCSPKKSPSVTGQKRLALGAVAAWSGGMVETARQPLQGRRCPGTPGRMPAENSSMEG